MLSSREKYFKNYQLEQIPDNSKKGYKNIYKYIGDYYTWDISDSDIKLSKISFVLAELCTSIIFFITARQNIPLNKSVYIAVPAVLSLCCWPFEIIGIAFFFFLQFPLKEEDYKRIDSTFSLTFIVRGLFLTAISLLCFIETITSKPESGGFLVSAGYLACASIALAMHIKYKHIKSHKKVILRNQ